MTQPDIHTVEARRRVAAMDQAPGMAEAILSGEFTPSIIDLLAATLRELNWQPPVDPDLVEARKLVDEEGHTMMSLALAAIKRGRELEATERGA